MKSWQEDHLNSLLAIESEQELFNEIAILAKDMGFDYCAYGIQMSVPISRPFVASFNNFSKDWQVCQQDHTPYLDAESAPQAGHRRRRTIAWLHSTKCSSTLLNCGARRAHKACITDGRNFRAMPAGRSAC